jgi:hypothetical protein
MGRPMFEQAFKNIDDVLRKEAGCTTELDYTEQTSRTLVAGTDDRLGCRPFVILRFAEDGRSPHPATNHPMLGGFD